MSDLYRDFIDQKADQIINSLGGTITPAPANAELYRDFLDRKFDDVINACNGLVKIKSFSYTGDGASVNNITFPERAKYVLNIQRETTNGQYQLNSMVCPLIWGFTAKAIGIYQGSTPGVQYAIPECYYVDDTHIRIVGTSAGQAYNATDRTYQVLYIPYEN